MNRKMLSDALIAKAVSDARFKMTATRDYTNAALTAIVVAPEIAIVEIPESGSWSSAEKCLAICDGIRKRIHDCKQVILCNEEDTDSCNAAIQAKQEGRIDDFLFYDNSLHYLFSKLEALTPKE
jgi:hypothetical protein